MRNINVVVLAVLLHTTTSQTTFSHPICRQIENVFQSLCSEESLPTTLNPTIGIPGKKGPPGEKGDAGIPGIKGSTGVVDYERISSIIEQNVLRAIEKNDKLNALTSQLEEMSHGLSQAEGDIWKLQSHEGICGVKYEGKCFWIEIRHVLLNYEKGREICKTRGGVPANIYSEKHYEEITTYVRAQMPSNKNNYYFWLGMRANPSTRAITLADGTPAPYTKWHRGYPSSQSGYTHMAMHVRIPHDTKYYRDMYNYPPSETRIGVLCEI